MNFNEKGLAIIKHFESCRLKPYWDDRKPPKATIGWGNTFYKNGTRVKITDSPLTQSEADELLDYHIYKFIKEVRSLVKVNLNDDQFSALVSFAYNIGSDIDKDNIAEGLGDSTLLKKINKNPSDVTIPLEFEKWDRSGGIKLKGLLRRRKSEARLFKDGVVHFFEEVK